MRLPRSSVRSGPSKAGCIGSLENFFNVMRTRRSQFSSDPVPAEHRTVLLHEAIDALALERGDTIVDATLGGAGHAKQILDHLGTTGILVGFDADRHAIERARTQLAGIKANVHLINANFRHMERE